MRRPPNVRAMASLAAAFQAAANAPALVGDAAQAERERFRLEDEARRSVQGCLMLGSSPE